MKATITIPVEIEYVKQWCSKNCICFIYGYGCWTCQLKVPAEVLNYDKMNLRYLRTNYCLQSTGDKP